LNSNPAANTAKIIKFDRQHTYASCNNSFTLKADNNDVVPNNYINKNSSSILIMHPTSDEQHQVNISYTQKLSDTKDLTSTLASATIQQYSVPFRFLNNSIPLYFDAENYKLLTLQTGPNGTKLVHLHSWPVINPTAISSLNNQQQQAAPKLPPILEFTSAHKYYWFTQQYIQILSPFNCLFLLAIIVLTF
jgi:hypothetical protein